MQDWFICLLKSGFMKYLIVGLGNIGVEYRDTRHNVGFMVLDRLAEAFEAKPELARLAFTVAVKYKGRQLHLVMPTTFMNRSGKAVKYYLDTLKIPPENLLVITDDIALPFGGVRMRGKGSAGGHNGLKDIQQVLGSDVYARMRVGVGDDFRKGQQVDFVLSPFTDEEFDALPETLDHCVKGIYAFVTMGIDRAMSEVNRKK